MQIFIKFIIATEYYQPKLIEIVNNILTKTDFDIKDLHQSSQVLCLMNYLGIDDSYYWFGHYDILFKKMEKIMSNAIINNDNVYNFFDKKFCDNFTLVGKLWNYLMKTNNEMFKMFFKISKVKVEENCAEIVQILWRRKKLLMLLNKNKKTNY